MEVSNLHLQQVRHGESQPWGDGANQAGDGEVQPRPEVHLVSQTDGLHYVIKLLLVRAAYYE